MKYYGKISYTMDKNHPDVNCVTDFSENDIYTYDDTYTFSDGYEEEVMADYIKRDLSLVAGGGYNAKHIHNVTFEIKRI